jgi:hypothetical protein
MSFPKGLYDLLISNEVEAELQQLDGCFDVERKVLQGADRRRRLIADLSIRLANFLQQQEAEEDYCHIEIQKINQILADIKSLLKIPVRNIAFYFHTVIFLLIHCSIIEMRKNQLIRVDILIKQTCFVRNFLHIPLIASIFLMRSKLKVAMSISTNPETDFLPRYFIRRSPPYSFAQPNTDSILRRQIMLVL